jgi:hypothetical protein
MKTPTPPIPKPEWVHRFAVALCHRIRLIGMTTATSLADEAYERGTDPEAAARSYKPGGDGDFTRQMRLHNWPPGFVSRLDPNPGEVARREAAVRGRATQLANGHTGSMKNGLSKKSAAVLPRVEKALVS